MKKIPTIFERDWDGDRSRVVDQPHPDCAWVFAGEGVATRKLDGACAAVIGVDLYKRREVKGSKPDPEGFIEEHYDPTTGKRVGWVPVGDGPEDRYFMEAWQGCLPPMPCTLELIGPKVQGNPERYEKHTLVPHKSPDLIFLHEPERTFEGLKVWLTGQDIEGIVFHHPDGRMAKIKLRDFGLKRGMEQ